MGVGEEGDYIYLSLHCPHQNDSCIKIGSGKGHFNISLNVRDKVTRQCPQTTTFEEKRQPKRIRTEVPLLTSLTLTPRPNRLTLREGVQSLLLKQTYIVAKNPYNYIAEKGALFFSYTRVIQGVHPDDTIFL